MFEVAFLLVVGFLWVKAVGFIARGMPSTQKRDLAHANYDFVQPWVVVHERVLRPKVSFVCVNALLPPLTFLLLPVAEVVTVMVSTRHEPGQVALLASTTLHLLRTKLPHLVTLSVATIVGWSLVSLKGYRLQATSSGFSLDGLGRFERRWTWNEIRAAKVLRYWGVRSLVLELDKGKTHFALGQFHGVLDFFAQTAPDGHPLRNPERAS